ncbi:esterase family protein [Nostoc sp. FACHB-87]|uniref:alpha/beta hydrolase n=1 Tax=Nostocaceae TaxID=1162 RepID=UPI001681D04F|nr:MULTISPECIES: alpha/beta hydrolase-fold protein [Nostocaceae]MBD2452740.1 esterase family protein [Nostoc sp. FACHB-87]MBD2473671.1 esterase family protein [Anabaena sp. FACHB-83]
MKIPKLFLSLAGAIAILTGAAYYYVFILGAPQFDPPQQQVDTGLKFQLETFNSQAMGTVRQYGVILPPNYQKNPKTRYPVIFLLHGGHDDARAYADKYAIINVLHELYKTGKLPPSIIITPDGNDNRGSSPLYDPDYYDGTNGKIGTLIGAELVQVVKSRYRTLENPEFWALGGLSSGGWGAFNIGLRYLNNFNILFSHSGYFTDSSGAQNSPLQIVQQLSTADRKRLRIYLDAGLNDQNFLASTKIFHQTLNNLDIANVFYAFPGGHGLSGADVGWNYFHKHLKDSLAYVGEQFKTFKK